MLFKHRGDNSFFELKINFFNTILYSLIFLLFIVLLVCTALLSSSQYFTFLAQGFLEGHFYFPEYAKIMGDAALYNQHLYWPLGVLPAIILLPIVALFNYIGIFFFQEWLVFFLVIIVCYIIYSLVRRLNFSKADSLYWIMAFFGGSVFLFVSFLQWSHYLSHIIVVLFLFLALLEYFTHKRYWLIGLYLGLVLMTRLSAGLCIIFFIFDILYNSTNLRKSVLKLILLMVPWLTALILIFIYNYLRFDNIFEQGYSYAILTRDYLEIRQYGLFNIKNIITNFYYSFLAGPLPILRSEISFGLAFPYISPGINGLSIFITSPFLIYLFFGNYKEKVKKFLLVTSIFIYLGLLLFFSVGAHQIGYRYSLDFLPLLFLLVLLNYREKNESLSSGMRLLIIISTLFNLYLFFSYFGIYNYFSF